MDRIKWDRFLLVLIILSSVGRINAQDGVEYIKKAEREFNSALYTFDRGSYRQAAEAFESITEMRPVHQRTTAAMVMAARAFLLSDQPEKTISLIGEFLKRYSGSAYKGEAHFILGDALMEIGYESSALGNYIDGILEFEKEGIFEIYSERISQLFQQSIKLQELDRALSCVRNDEVSTRLYALWIECKLQIGEVEAAREGFQRITNAEHSRETQTLLNKITRAFGGNNGQHILGIVLPKPASDLAVNTIVRDIRDGILTAIDLHHEQGGCKIEPEIVHASTSDTLRRIFQSYSSNENVIGIIGGVFSDDAALVSEGICETNVPCLLPAATAEDLVTKGKNIFQMNAPFSVRGRMLADYAKHGKKASRVVILAPSTTFARSIATSFIERANEIGLQINDIGWYSRTAKDIHAQTKALAARNGVLDSMTILFLPIASKKEISHILAAYHSTGLLASILGAGDWNHPDELRIQAGMNISIEFESDFAVNTHFSQFLSFSEAYKKRTDREYSRHSVFGYDAARFFLSSLSNGVITREKILDRFRMVYFGLRSPVNFSRTQCNEALNIMKYHNGTVYRLKSIPED